MYIYVNIHMKWVYNNLMLSQNTFIKKNMKITIFLSLNRNNTGGESLI